MRVSTKCSRAAKFFPSHLTKIREEAGLSKNALSEIAGLSQSYLVLLEQGER
ncbi:MAG: helix-turn-helix domain-containing protein, partial [Akkermansiaceae bacterium]